MKNLIGICGRKGSGKDTIANMLQDIYPTYEIKKFSDKLKDTVAILYGCNRINLESEDFKENMYFNYKHHVKIHFSELKKLLGNKTIISDVKELEEQISKNQTDFWVNYRLILQYEGTEVGRNKRGSEFWVTSIFSKYRSFSSHWLFTDCRFPNEAMAIINRNGILLNIERSSIKSNDTHISEQPLEKVVRMDYTIENNGSLEDLKKEVDNFLDFCNNIENFTKFSQ